MNADIETRNVAKPRNRVITGGLVDHKGSAGDNSMAVREKNSVGDSVAQSQIVRVDD